MGRRAWAAAVVAGLWACAGPEPTELERTVGRFRASLGMKGDPARGRRIFEKSCIQCHRAGPEGHEAGPDLAAFRSRPPERLLVDIVDPNREVEPRYAAFKVLTSEGELLDGLLARRDASGVTLQRAGGETDVIPLSKIQRMEATRFSLMPEGLEQGLDFQQMADLLAFIRGYN